MLTLFSVPKPFDGHIGDIQGNAIASWRALGHGVQVVLVGEERGVAEAARDAGIEHVGALATNDRGTPRLDSAFERASTVARWPLWCFVNGDIVLLDDFLPAVVRVASAFDEFLLVGECRDLDVGVAAPLTDPVRPRLRELALEHGRRRGHAALDYFVFPRGLFDPVPPFLVGRAGFDNWLVWRARATGRRVVDATGSIVAIHQPHDYAHVPDGREGAYDGPEARLNRQLAGGKGHIYSLHDATHRLPARGRPLPYWGSAFRARERARRARWRMSARVEARRVQRGFERPLRLVGVLPRPAPETAGLFDALSAAPDADVAVLYASHAAPSAPEPLRHVHWYPRSFRIVLLERVLRRDYPVNWALWLSMHRLRPDCVLVSGVDSFAAQATIAWCLARRVPYLLLLADGVPLRGAAARRVARRAHAVLGSAATPRASIPGAAPFPTLPVSAGAAAACVLELARRAWHDGRPAPGPRARLPRVS